MNTPQRQLHQAERVMREYDTRHDAMDIIYSARDEAMGAARLQLGRVINYLRDTALDTLPWAADVLPNRDSYGRRHGGLV